MAIISDIRIYRSDKENVAGYNPAGFGNKELKIIIRRIVMKLRESDFSLGEFDHLYINFTTCPVEGKIAMAKRSVDKYFPWYRYFDVEVSRAFWDTLEGPNCIDDVIELVEQVLVQCFCTDDAQANMVRECIRDAVINGEKMTMKFKEKNGAKNRAVLYLRYLDDGCYFPLLKVFDLNGELILEQDLQITRSLDDFGEIQLSSQKVTIKPRKNSVTKALGLEPVSYNIPKEDDNT